MISGGTKSPNTLCSPPKIEMPESTANISFTDIQKAWEAYNASEIAHPLRQLNWVLDRNTPLSQWEIDELEKAFVKFQAQYLSPLAKGMK